MLGVKNLNKQTLSHLMSCELIDIASLDNENLEFFIYRINLFKMCDKLKIRTFDFISTNRFNLEQLLTMEDGDIVSFNRGIYTHHALLTGYLTN